MSMSGACGETSVGLVGGSGRRSVAWSMRACSLVVVVGLSVPLYQFPVQFPMLGGRFQGILCCLASVRSRPILCVSVCFYSSRPVPLSACSSRCDGEAVGLFPVPCISSVWRCGGGCLLACARRGWRGWRCRLSRPVLAYRLFDTGSGEAVMSGVSRLACLDVGIGVDVRRPAAPVSVRLPSPYLTV